MQRWGCAPVSCNYLLCPASSERAVDWSPELLCMPIHVEVIRPWIRPGYSASVVHLNAFSDLRLEYARRLKIYIFIVVVHERSARDPKLAEFMLHEQKPTATIKSVQWVQKSKILQQPS